MVGGPYQRLGTPNLLSVHPPERTDPFTLLIKGTVMISRIIIFYSRLKLQGETDIESSFPLGRPLAEIRASTGFKELDNMVDTFKLNIPREYRDPFTRGMMMNSPQSGPRMSIDPICYAAHILPAACVFPESNGSRGQHSSQLQILSVLPLYCMNHISILAT